MAKVIIVFRDVEVGEGSEGAALMALTTHFGTRRKVLMGDEPCVTGHTWTHQFGDDWTPEHGTPCDCGKKRWGIPLVVAREHDWEFYANGTFCKRCGAAIGSGTPCR